VELKFGFLREECQLSWSEGSIESLPTRQAMVDNLDSSGRVCGDWLYPPLVDASGIPQPGKPHPEVLAKIFELAPTHKLTIVSGPDDPEFANFLIALFGLMKGLRLVPEGWQHFYRVPLKCGMLCDFLADNSSIAKMLELATEFWQKNNLVEVQRGIFGAIHWHLFGQLYEHEFERFNAQYIVLDSCFALFKSIIKLKKDPGHGERPSLMCTEYGLAVPSWAVKGLAKLRNQFFHEGLYGGSPIGFSHPTDIPSIELELTSFNARLILAILGVRNIYTKSSVDTHQRYGFDM
jgi:hypothetical protein